MIFKQLEQIQDLLFKFWLNEKFLHILQQKNNYFDNAVIITDGLIAHKNAFNSIDLVKKNLVKHYSKFEPHSSDQVQWTWDFS